MVRYLIAVCLTGMMLSVTGAAIRPISAKFWPMVFWLLAYCLPRSLMLTWILLNQLGTSNALHHLSWMQMPSVCWAGVCLSKAGVFAPVAYIIPVEGSSHLTSLVTSLTNEAWELAVHLHFQTLPGLFRMFTCSLHFECMHRNFCPCLYALLFSFEKKQPKLHQLTLQCCPFNTLVISVAILYEPFPPPCWPSFPNTLWSMVGIESSFQWVKFGMFQMSMLMIDASGEFQHLSKNCERKS